VKWPEVSLSSALASAEVFVDGDWVESKDQDPNGDVRLVQLADVGDGEYLDKSARFLTSGKARELRCTFLKPGDVLVARMPDPLGRACMFPGDAKPSVTVVDVCIIRPNPAEQDARWLMHCLNSAICRNQIAGFATGTTRSRISRSNLGKVKIPSVPLVEQRRIVKVLDEAEALRAKRRSTLAQLDILTQAIFLDMFGDPATNPKGWPLRQLATEIESVRYGTGSPPSYVEEGIPFIRATNIKDGTVSPKDLKRITPADAEQLAKCRVRTGDLIVVRSGVNTGDCAIVPPEYDGACAAFDLIIELPRSNAVFYNFLINSAFGKRHLAPLTRRAAQPHLNADQFRTLSFVAPAREAKERFAELVAGVDTLKGSHRASLAELDALFYSLQHRAFRGDL
jgi:type I restriction enzyme, S subunit